MLSGSNRPSISQVHGRKAGEKSKASDDEEYHFYEENVHHKVRFTLWRGFLKLYTNSGG